MNFGKSLTRTITSQARMPKMMEISPSQRENDGFLSFVGCVILSRFLAKNLYEYRGDPHRTGARRKCRYAQDDMVDKKCASQRLSFGAQKQAGAESDAESRQNKKPENSECFRGVNQHINPRGSCCFYLLLSRLYCRPRNYTESCLLYAAPVSQ